MTIPRAFIPLRGVKLVAIFVAVVMGYGSVAYSKQSRQQFVNISVELKGATGATNNTALAYGRYALIAPYWPSRGVAYDGLLDLTKLDNSVLYAVDTKRPTTEPVSKMLSSFDAALGLAKTVFFPTKVIFDPNSGIVFVRGTRFEDKVGVTTAIDVIAYVRFYLNVDGKPTFDTNVIPIDIEGVSTKYTGEAPLDFAISGRGDLMVFTNGASVFSYNIAQGYLFRVDIVPESDYSSSTSHISFLDLDPTTDIVSVCWNRTTVNKDGSSTATSDLSFFKLEGDSKTQRFGTFQLIKHVPPDQFPKGASLADGSSIAIAKDVDKDGSELACFVSTDGSLCTVDLSGESVTAAIKQMYVFPEIGASAATHSSPFLVRYDASSRTIGIVRPGFTIQISRPSNGRPGRISRPSNMHIASEDAMLGMARLGKKKQITSVNWFTEIFRGEGGLSNFVSGQGSQWLISTYSGKLYSVDVPIDLQKAQLQFVGNVGSRVDRIDYYADRTSVAAINAFALEDSGNQIATPGALVVGKISPPGSQSPGQATLQTNLPTASTLSRPVISIRRPCNVKR